MFIKIAATANMPYAYEYALVLRSFVKHSSESSWPISQSDATQVAVILFVKPRHAQDSSIKDPRLGHTHQALAVQGKLSRLGKEARAARHDPKGSTNRPAASPDASQAASKADSDSDDNNDDTSFQEEVEGAGGRRTRQASAQRESSWQNMEATPPKQKSRRKASCDCIDCYNDAFRSCTVHIQCGPVELCAHQETMSSWTCMQSVAQHYGVRLMFMPS